MEDHKFTYEGKEYVLNENNLDYFFIDEEHPVEGIDEELVMSLLHQRDDVDFSLEYYSNACENCEAGKGDKARLFKFLEYHFYIFTKNGEYVTSSISNDYQNTSFNKLLRAKKADNSYIVSIAVCVSCGKYSIEIEECEV